MILVGLRFFIEIVLHDPLEYACNYILTGDNRSYQFVSYWFCSIVFTEYACYGFLIFSIYLRKREDWDRLLRLPLKLPKTNQEKEMENLLGGLIEETEANRFKPVLVEDSEITYKVNTEFEDKFEYT